jgi:DNA-binding NarL/FixJ family response regulator
VAASKPIRVLVADDTPDIRLLLRSSLGLNDAFEVVAEASDGVESIREAARHRPDVVILDLAMPLMDGLEAIPAIRRRSPDSKIVVLSVFPSERMAGAVLEAGADAYLEKTDVHRLVPLLIALYDGGSPPPGTAEASERADEPSPTVERPGAVPALPQDPSSEVLQALAHELLSPVTVIMRLAETVQTSLDELPEDTVRKCLESISRNASHMAELIQSLSDAHRVDAGMLALDPEPTDLGDLVRQAVADVASVMERHSFEASEVPDLVVSVDAVRIRQVLTNLLTNAAKFSPEGSRITVQMSADDVAVEISVADEGPGIAPELLGEAFDKFSRLSSVRKGGGLGLGLYIARGIVRAHGGELTESSGDEEGARFSIRLPRTT